MSAPGQKPYSSFIDRQVGLGPQAVIEIIEEAIVKRIKRYARDKLRVIRTLTYCSIAIHLRLHQPLQGFSRGV